MTPVVMSASPTTLEVATGYWQLAHRLAGTEFVPGTLRGKPEAVLACILSGHELGIGPMQALQKIHVIDGRPAQAAELMRAIVQAHGHEVWFEEMSTTSVTIVGRRADQTRETRVTWTMDDARKAGLADKQNWRKYPRSMLMARATGELCRAMFADVLAGISYTMEELSDGEAIDVADLTYRRDADTGSATVAADVASIESPGKATRTKKAKKSAAPRAAATPQHVPLPGEGGGDEDDIADGEIIDDMPDDDPDGSDDVTEGEIVDERPPESSETPETGSADTVTPDEFPPDNEPPVDTGPRYTPAQAVVMRMESMGFTDRTVRLTMLSSIVEREITSANDLTHDEVSVVMRALDDDDGSATVPASATEGDVVDDDGAKDGGAVPASPPSPSAHRGADPEEMTGDQWRDVLKRRGVKAAELLRKARELAGSNVATLDDIAGRGVGQDLLDFVEDLALSRGK
jgi:hypothetical protein